MTMKILSGSLPTISTEHDHEDIKRFPTDDFDGHHIDLIDLIDLGLFIFYKTGDLGWLKGAFIFLLPADPTIIPN